MRHGRFATGLLIVSMIALVPASTPLQIPPELAPGTYYVLARADYNGAITETTETNNDKFDSTVIGGDLVVTAAAAPTSCAAPRNGSTGGFGGRASMTPAPPSPPPCGSS